MYGVVVSARGYRNGYEAIAGETVAPYVSAVTSFFVNFIVTFLIGLQIVRTRRRTKALMGHSGSMPGDTMFAVAIIVESALPASCIAVYVPIATYLTHGGPYVSRVAWVACTVSNHPYSPDKRADNDASTYLSGSGPSTDYVESDEEEGHPQCLSNARTGNGYSI